MTESSEISERTPPIREPRLAYISGFDADIYGPVADKFCKKLLFDTEVGALDWTYEEIDSGQIAFRANGENGFSFELYNAWVYRFFARHSIFLRIKNERGSLVVSSGSANRLKHLLGRHPLQKLFSYLMPLYESRGSEAKMALVINEQGNL